MGALALAALMMAGGCSGAANTAEEASRPRTASPSPAAAIRVVKPEKLLSGWPESTSGTLRDQAQHNTDTFKPFLDGEATSEVGAAYALLDNSTTILVSGVSGKVTDPKGSLDKIFAALPKLSDIQPIRPGPMGGEARCGKGETQDVKVHVCAWADNRTIGMVTQLGSSAFSPNKFVQARSQIERPLT
ncbi:hypothetical protein [Micromonospora sp. AMSO31t]|uniref:hypothetical protein n=1 Tax=Micromonospora sp. AMSO31t TaxID=2650566 RepID=UPI00124B5462|nr:hypothetical protein [Micromonospora sp. AMSO31t]KAB1913467.1 hypothetical protein F8274_10515 [Micromonospora sp. AMSO31t]